MFGDKYHACLYFLLNEFEFINVLAPIRSKGEVERVAEIAYLEDGMIESTSLMLGCYGMASLVEFFGKKGVLFVYKLKSEPPDMLSMLVDPDMLSLN